ncbi:uncharacterized protein LOC119338279 [Triticum dicoccoides]|uniref:Dirigent protein n=1 Tax=Triticum turgidum subsp. durum TaxID=4567 RepID=A0A9R1ACZ3_TRITD|nr:uncharacterized protein LOC119338279 [Triticum dicoccoides]VAI94014.1 unnamed protein product [Triticum turgidum subsp. durum]
MATHPNFHASAFDGSVQNTEFKFSSLYWHHIYSGPSPNQSVLIGAEATTGLGQSAVNDWTIYGGVGSDVELVARAQGLHLYAGSWHNTFTLRFEIERLKKSTLQVMGASVEDEGEWSIVGGTGDLAMARGVVAKRLHEKTDGGDIVELTIHGFCRMQLPILNKRGPWGGKQGSAVGLEKPSKIASITIHYQEIINSFEYIYVDQYGNIGNTNIWGTKSPNHAEIVLGPDEIVTGMSGTVIKHNNLDVIQTLMFTTSKKTYGPYGNTTNIQGGTTFSTVVPNGQAIVGFFGHTDMKCLNGIGVYMA